MKVNYQIIKEYCKNKGYIKKDTNNRMFFIHGRIEYLSDVQQDLREKFDDYNPYFDNFVLNSLSDEPFICVHNNNYN